MATLLPSDIRQRVVDDFGVKHANSVCYQLLKRIPRDLPNGTQPRHLRCILYLAEGDEERLERYIEMCLTDSRDVMLSAEYEGDRRVRDFDKPFDEAQIEAD